MGALTSAGLFITSLGQVVKITRQLSRPRFSMIRTVAVGDRADMPATANCVDLQIAIGTVRSGRDQGATMSLPTWPVYSIRMASGKRSMPFRISSRILNLPALSQPLNSASACAWSFDQ